MTLWVAGWVAGHRGVGTVAKDDYNASIYTFSVLKLLFDTVAEAREP